MKRNIGFDVARSISMFYIVAILHLTGYTNLAISQNNAFVSLIWSTLGVFTFLSSFLLASRYNFNSRKDIYNFYRKRVLRFYPLFLISSVLLWTIHFNTTAETVKGVLGLSPFWKPQQHTLWYISMLIGLYIITPIISKNNFKYQCCVFTVIISLIGLVDYLFHSIDPRIYYYYIVYFGGIICAKYHYYKKLNLKLLFSISSVIYIGLFIWLTKSGNRLIMMTEGYLGIYVILYVCNQIGKQIQNNNKLKSLISFLSFASMCAYLFHREIYWALLYLWTPKSDWGVIIYLFCIGVPLVFFISYYIQRIYDKAIKSL